jgi:hypothetical protein
MLLADPEWAGWTDREIGRRAHVAHTFVGKLRSILVSDTSMKSDRKFTHPKTGTVSTMHTENIGKRGKSWDEFTESSSAAEPRTSIDDNPPRVRCTGRFLHAVGGTPNAWQLVGAGAQ